jgi:hypothetical protein
VIVQRQGPTSGATQVEHSLLRLRPIYKSLELPLLLSNPNL